MFHRDLKVSFLYGDLQEEIWMKQLKGFVQMGKEDMVFLLKKSLYGLK